MASWSAPNGLGIGAGGAGANAFPFASGAAPTAPLAVLAPNAPGQQRRPLAHNGLGGMGALHHLPVLLEEVAQESRSMLFSVAYREKYKRAGKPALSLAVSPTLMGDVEGVLGGRGVSHMHHSEANTKGFMVQPPNLQAFPAHLPPVRPPTEAAPQPPSHGTYACPTQRRSTTRAHRAHVTRERSADWRVTTTPFNSGGGPHCRRGRSSPSKPHRSPRRRRLLLCCRHSSQRRRRALRRTLSVCVPSKAF